tara:strand:+ start:28365 stop:35180 length:6816 start_codon:yes stop_codon:yes gene_type:complete
MKNCSITNKVNGKESVLLQELLAAYNNDQNAAEVAYGRVQGSEFKDNVFGDWEADYKNTPESEVPDLGTVNPLSGEPKLFKNELNSQHYFLDRDGDKYFIDKVAFSEFELDEVEDVTKYLLYQYVSDGGKRTLNDFEASKLESGKVMKSINKSIESYKETIKGSNNEEALLAKIELVEKHKEEYKDNLISAISELGYDFVEVSEEDRGGGVNIKEAFETNGKDTATVNTKIFLSTIESQVFNEEGRLEGIRGGFLQTKSFENFNEVWTTLQNLLVDEVGYGHGQNVKDIYDIMYEKLEGVYEAKPWISDLLDKLVALPETKQTEFAQAFVSTKLNFLVTEVDEDKYTVINATSTNSRQSQVTSTWSTMFADKFLDKGVMQAEHKENLALIEENIKTIGNNFDGDIYNFVTNEKDPAIALEQEKEAINKAVTNLMPQLEYLGMVGIFDEDFNNMIVLNGGVNKQVQTVNEIFKGLNFMMSDTINNAETKWKKRDGNMLNPFDVESNVKQMAYAVGFRETDMADAGILANNGKMYYSFSKPTYLSNKINEWKKDKSELKAMAADPTKQNSVWLKFLLAHDEPEGKTRDYKSDQRINAMKLNLASSFKSKGKNDGVENTEITLDDQILDNMTKLLGSKIPGGKSYFPTIVAADKSRRIEIGSEGSREYRLNHIDSGINFYNGTVNIGDKTIQILTGYFKDEYSRMQKVARENKELPKNKKVTHYHGEEGNGRESQIFPEFSYNGKDPKYQALRDALYDSNGDPLLDDTNQGLSSEQNRLFQLGLRASIADRLDETIAELDKIAANDNWNKSNINSDLVKAYTNNKKDYKHALAGDYLLNGLVASVEYTKLFSGDPAYYKNTADLIKRIPATYTDGLQLRLKDSDNLIFNQATIEGVEVASKYVDKILKSVKDKSIADAYRRVNTTDAQAWITPRRWRFLKKGLGQWGPQHDKVFELMETGGEMTPQESKLAAQPLKGVYFEINDGRPVYLKYSQAVLIPSLVKGTPMERMLSKMTLDANGKKLDPKDEIHEVITIDGVKVGAVGTTKVHNDGTTELSDNIELNPVVLSNRGWKLQQDLPVKLMHETNVGSQIQKNILEGINMKGEYVIDGKTVLGSALIKEIHNTVSALSNIGKAELKERLGIDDDNRITKKEAIYQALIEEFKSRDGSNNIIAALEKEMPFDAIPQIRGKVESIFNSIANKAMTKISTSGGSFIQVSPFGLEKVGSETQSALNEDEMLELETLKGIKETLSSNEEWIILNSIPKISSESANKETGMKIGVNQDINPSWISNTGGVSINKAVDDILADNPDINMDPQDVRQSIIDYISMTKNDAREEIFAETRYKELLAAEKKGSVEIEIESGIQIVSKNYNKEALLPPRIEKGKVLPGQAMIPHSEAMKIFKANGISIKGKSLEELVAMLDPSALEMITYRIPNQGMSSNDYLEIVGIMPPGMGDSIIVYDGLPAKTGSDFDIDKLFAMQNSLVWNSDTNKLEKLTKANSMHFPKKDNATEKDIKNRDLEIQKKLVQNKLVSTYKAVLNSPLTYDNMMTSIDGAFLKDDIAGNPKKGIEGLFPAPVMRNLELFSPIQQLKTKFEYISGKFGVGQTANQLVDHVSNQTLDIRLDHWIGIGNKREENGTDITFFDTATDDKNSIATNISAFLNAYVDIAKDPYIARGNHNSVTANVTFMLLRAGADLKWINRFIGQPIIKDFVEATKRAEAITAKKLKIYQTLKTGETVQVDVSPMEYIFNKKGFPTAKVSAEQSATYVSLLTADALEENIRGERNSGIDYHVIEAFKFLQEEGKKFTEGVSAAKSDTAGAGGSNVERMVNSNKIKKVLKDKFLVGYDTKFTGTMLGTYKYNTLDWLGDVVSKSNLFFSGLRVVEDTFNYVSQVAAKGDVLINKDLAKSIDNSFYSYMMSSTSLFKNNNTDFDRIMRETPQKVKDLQKEESSNFLINELEIEQREGFSFIGINSKNKPKYYQDKIGSAWLRLYNDPATKDLATDLARYAYSQSGFQNNLNQFFTYIPHEILKDANISSEIKGMFKDIEEVFADADFVDQFMRHSWDDPKIVSRIRLNSMEAVDFKGSSYAKDSAFIYRPSRVESGDIGLKERGKERVFPKFVSSKVGEDILLYKREGTVKRIDSQGKTIDVPVYYRTHKLGLKSGRNRIFEYKKGFTVKKSNIEENNIHENLSSVRAKAFMYVKNNEESYIAEKTTKIIQFDSDGDTLNKAEDLVSSGGQIEMDFEGPMTNLSLDAIKKAIQDLKNNGDIEQENC